MQLICVLSIENQKDAVSGQEIIKMLLTDGIGLFHVEFINLIIRFLSINC